MQKGSKHSSEAREMMKRRAQQREAPVVKYKRQAEQMQAWCEKYPGVIKAFEEAEQNGRDWARDLLRLLRPRG